VVAGCGQTNATPDRSYVPLTVGPGPAYRPPAAARPSAGLACRSAAGVRRGLHVELFAHRHVVVVPPGIGVVGGRRDGAYVRGGRCFYPLITREPTGVVELAARGRPPRLGDLFAVWGQPLSPTRLAGFGGGRVRAYVDGAAFAGDPRRIALRPHLEIVLELGGYVPPHRSYRFAPGL
jgi:hypothetical protein